MDTMSRLIVRQLNPIIGSTQAETLENAASAIDAASMFPEADVAGKVSDRIEWARGAFHDVVAQALRWEAGQK